MSITIAKARYEPALGARVIGRTPLLYTAGADAAIDRPVHVRAGSGLVCLAPGTLAVIQDDACFLAIVSVLDGDVRAVPLPAIDGARQFDDRRGNKARKLDLEILLLAGDRLLAFGSGSSEARETIVAIDDPLGEARVRAIEARALYRALAELFAGSELNLEGAAIVHSDVVFFQRGNGAGESFNATARADAASLFAYLDAGAPDALVPRVDRIERWDLGEIDGVRLTFTDATPKDDAIAFLACAEASADAIHDGPVSGVAIGRIAHGVAALGPVHDEHGAPLQAKTEGLAFDGARAWAVVDADDPDAPALLFELALGEGWS